MTKKLTGIIALMLALMLTVAACSEKEEAPSPAAESSTAVEPSGEASGDPMGGMDGMDGMLTYSDTEPVTYSFHYPELWTMEESGDPTSPVQFFGDKVTANINIEDIGDATLDDYATSAQDQLDSLGVTIESQTDSTLGSEPAVTIVSTQVKGNKSVLLSQTFAVVDGQAFVFTYGGTGAAFDENMGVAQSMIDSFTFG